jgi:hypothetical protein
MLENNLVRFAILMIRSRTNRNRNSRNRIQLRATLFWGDFARVSLKNVSRNRKPPKRFPFKKFPLGDHEKKQFFHVFPVFVNREKFRGKKSVRENWILKNIRKNSVYLFPIFYETNTDASAENPPPWNWKRKTFWKDENFPFIFNAKFSLSYTKREMFSFTARTQVQCRQATNTSRESALR